MTLKVAKKLRPVGLADLVDLTELSIVEKNVVSTTVNTLDVDS